MLSKNEVIENENSLIDSKFKQYEPLIDDDLRKGYKAINIKTLLKDETENYKTKIIRKIILEYEKIGWKIKIDTGNDCRDNYYWIELIFN